MDAKPKHLKFIQGVINRLATNPFRLKGWTVVLVGATAGIFGLADEAPAQDLARDKAVLVALYNALAGDHWTSNRNSRPIPAAASSSS